MTPQIELAEVLVPQAGQPTLAVGWLAETPLLLFSSRGRHTRLVSDWSSDVCSSDLPDYAKFAALGERGVLALCSDSTNVGRPGRTGSETEVGAALAGRFAGAPGRILIATFASHIHRIQQVLDLAARYGRRVALLGKSMVGNVAVAAELGYLTVPEGLLVSLDELAELPGERQVILSTGSQGETNSAVALIAAGEHKYVQAEPGDLVIFSSRVIPGNERVIGRAINALLRRGAEVLWEGVAR